ncbi:Sodium-driven chloride bicarbonate exchanger [Symbiodinium microadriaticum]|uniref:Sodium-driven chloride bicarbonate exchanger n=1 Tax=Symbiodinium microadriaticum TaxID=2951 RepID=A0A1Q9ET61_SYMMI|nr:Sodium-driven chloride bicarbonate exchanger [Symbiodinium microadriaticum]
MLRIQTVSGEELVTLDLASFLETHAAGMHPVRALKEHLRSLCGLSRFRQRLVFLDDRVVLDDDGTLRPGEVQVVLLRFCPASDAQVTALRGAARHGLSAEVETFLQRPQDPDLGDPAPLFEASEHGQTEVARLLVEANADKDKATLDGTTPLFIAAQEGQLEVVRLLLEGKADMDKATRRGTAPLFIAAQKGQLEVARLLLEAKADRDKASLDGTTALFIAAQEGQLELLRLLLEANADMDKATQDGATPLFTHAAEYGQLEVARLLLDCNADGDKAMQDGITPLFVAAAYGQLEVARLLLEANADKDKARKDGATPLFAAAAMGQLEVVRLLLEVNADKDKATQDGTTPLFIAAEDGRLKVSRLLLEANADKDKAKQDGATPLFIADQRGHLDIARLLRHSAGGSRNFAKPITQEIPIVNPTDREWAIKPTFSQIGHEFDGPREFFAKKKGVRRLDFDLPGPTATVTTYPLTFKPEWVCDVKAQLVLYNVGTNETYEYDLHGIAEEPLAEEHVVVKSMCEAREKTSHVFSVKNHSNMTATFEVESDLVHISGPSSIQVDGRGTGEYELVFQPLQAGQVTGCIMFRDTHTGHFTWYTVELMTLPPKPQQQLTLTCVVRQAVAVDIQLVNPLDDVVVFEVALNGDGLLGEAEFVLAPKETATYELVFSPLLPARTKGTAVFFNEVVGRVDSALDCFKPRSSYVPLEAGQLAKLPSCAEAVYRYESGNIAHAPKKDYGPLDFTGKLAGGLRLDIRRRAPLYCSDWTDAFRFIAALAPAITFGSRFLDGTNGQFGVMEMIMSTCISGLIFSTFSGQPLSILGATGPFLAYTLVVYDLAVAVDVEFMPFYFWTCMWCSLFTVLVAVFDLCALMKHVTMFSEDIFAGLISLIFIIDGARPIIENFTESRLTLTNCMFEALLFIWTFGLATYLSSFRRSPWTFRFVRNFAANFAVTIALVSGSALAAIYSNDTGLRMLQVDADFSPNLSLSDGSKRPWIINPAGMDRPFPAWGIAYAILPAIGFAVLGYLDQNLTSVFVRGALTLPVCAVLGLPLSVASTVPSITHVISLTTYEVKQLPEGERKVPTKVVEQIHVLIGSALFLAPVLKFLPRAVLQGVFFYMGIASLTGNNLFDRLKLWLIWDPAKYPQYHYVQKLPISRVHLYTVVQVVCLGILYGLKAIKETSVVFPFFMASLAIIRKAMRFMFTEDELKQLDGLPGEDEEEDASMSKPDIVNLDVKEVLVLRDASAKPFFEGEFWYDLSLIAEAALPEEIPLMQCELGRTAQTTVKVDNPTGQEVMNNRITLPPLESTEITIEYSVTEEAQIVFEHPSIGSWVYKAQGLGLPPLEARSVTVAAQVNRTVSSTIQFKHGDQLSCQLEVPPQHQVSKCFDISLDSEAQISLKVSFGGIRAGIQGTVCQDSRRAGDAEGNLVITRASGGRWRFDLKLEATEPEVDDIISIQSPLNKPASVVTYKPTEYGKPVQGKLIIQTEDVFWSYLVKGTHPKYSAPVVDKPKVATRRTCAEEGRENDPQVRAEMASRLPSCCWNAAWHLALGSKAGPRTLVFRPLPDSASGAAPVLISMAREDAADEDEEDAQNRKHEFLNFRRQLDSMRSKQEGLESNADKLKSQGNQFFQLGLFTQASMMYSEALDLQPENTVLLNNRAMAYLKQGMSEEALADADRSLELDFSKENIKAFWRRAQALLDMGLHERAEDAANAGIAVQASNTHLARVRRKAREAIALRRLCGVDWVGKMENGVEKRYCFSQEGEMAMTVVGHTLKAAFDLSVECTPQSMVVKMQPIAGSGSAPPPPVPYIYSFHDDDKELWICHPVGSADLPKKFEKEEETGDESQPLDVRCSRYMREFCDILPLLPPQLPETPSQEEVSQEMLLMERVTKLKKQFGREVYALATGLHDRLVARKVIAADCQVVGPAQTAKAPDALNTNAQPAEKEAQMQPKGEQGLLEIMAGLVRKLCCK